MKLLRTLLFSILAISGCSSTGTTLSAPVGSAAESTTVAATVLRASAIAHPDCAATSASRVKVLEPGDHSSLEEWSVSCGTLSHSYQVLIARLGGGVTADVLEGDPIMLQPTGDECIELRRMLKAAEASGDAPTPDLIAANQQVMFKTLVCE